MEDDAERVDWGNDDDELQAPPESYPNDSPRQATGGYAGEDAEDAVSLGGDDEDEREFYAHHSTESTSVGGGVLSKSAAVIHSHTTKRDNQRQSATSSQHARAPSQSKNPESPTSGLRRTHSASTLPAPLTHALPPKPVVAPPHFRPPSPTGPGILASAMVHRQKKSNGSLKASDGGDPLPPDWEIRYPRTGGNEAYYFNVKTEESTWVRPKLPLSGTSSPTKERENGYMHLSGRRSPDDLDSALLDMSATGQGSRVPSRDTASRNTSPLPPAGDLTYHDRHYRPGEAPVPAGKSESGDRRSERLGVKPAHSVEAPYVRTRSPSPPESRRRPRSPSPAWGRAPRRDLSPPPALRGGLREAPRDFSQDRSVDATWGRSQRPDSVDDVQASSRSPPNRRPRRKDDIEPPLRRRNDDIEPPIRRKDDIEPPIRRKDDVEPWSRRKDDIEPPLRRKDDIEPPIRPLPRKQPSSRHANDEWPAPRPRSPPPHLREPSPPRRPAPSSFPPPAEGLLTPSSSNPRDSFRYGRSNTPPPRYPPRDQPLHPSTDSLPLRRTRDIDVPDTGYDQTKRRRLNEDLGPPRRFPPDLPPVAASLPAKPVPASFPAEGSPVDASHRKRAPLPPQDQQWRENRKAPAAPPAGPYANAPVVAPVPQGARFVPPPPPGDNGRRPYGPLDAPPVDRRDDRFRPPSDNGPPGPRRAGRSPPRDDLDRMRRPLPTGPGDRHSRFDPLPSPADRMDVDGPPPMKTTPAPRSTMGGMHADRMVAEPPRGPRAMAARDGPGGPYSSAPSGAPPPPPPAYNARPPMGPPVDPSIPEAGRGRGRPNDRRWETNDQDRRPSFSGPPSREASALPPFPPRRLDMVPPRDLPDRPGGRAPLPNDRRDDRPPSRISGTNSVPIGAKPTDHPSDAFAPNGVRSPVDRYRRADDVGDRLRRPPPGDLEPYDRRPPPPHDLPPSDAPRGDRLDRRLSVGQEGFNRARGDPMIDRPPTALPPRPRDAPRDDQPPRQSRFGDTSPAATSPALAPRVWQTRDEAQSGRAPEPRSNDDRAPREDTRFTRDGGAWEPRQDAPPPRRWPANDPYPSGPIGPDAAGSRTRSPEVPLRPRSITPPPQPYVPRFMERPLERPVESGKLHPERARLFVQEPHVPVHLRQPVRSPDRGYPDNVRRDIDRNLPSRPIDDARLPPPRERSPPPMQNGHRPGAKRGGSLLDRLTLDDNPPVHDGGSSLRDRVGFPSQGSSEGGVSAHAESMEVDLEGDDGGKAGGGRGMGRRRSGKPKRTRRNGAS